MEDGYSEDLAQVHDSGFGQMARDAGDLLVSELHLREIRRGRVVDLGCGSGILSQRVAEHGFEVLGVDLSASFVALAQARLPAGTFVQGSVFSTMLPACAAVAAVGEVVNYLFDESHSFQAIRDLLARAHDALVPGGLLLLDAAMPGRIPTGRRRSYFEGEDWAVLVDAGEEQDPSGGVLTRRITTFRRVGEHYRRSVEVHRQRLIPPCELAGWLRAAGFAVRELDGYGAEPFPTGLTGFLAVKRLR
jgi:SAM-dependent methyltransferase